MRVWRWSGNCLIEEVGGEEIIIAVSAEASIAAEQLMESAPLLLETCKNTLSALEEFGF